MLLALAGSISPLPDVIPDELYSFELTADWEVAALGDLLAAPVKTPPPSPPPMKRPPLAPEAEAEPDAAGAAEGGEWEWEGGGPEEGVWENSYGEEGVGEEEGEGEEQMEMTWWEEEEQQPSWLEYWSYPQYPGVHGEVLEVEEKQQQQQRRHRQQQQRMAGQGQVSGLAKKGAEGDGGQLEMGSRWEGMSAAAADAGGGGSGGFGDGGSGGGCPEDELARRAAWVEYYKSMGWDTSLLNWGQAEQQQQQQSGQEQERCDWHHNQCYHHHQQQQQQQQWQDNGELSEYYNQHQQQQHYRGAEEGTNADEASRRAAWFAYYQAQGWDTSGLEAYWGTRQQQQQHQQQQWLQDQQNNSWQQQWWDAYDAEQARAAQQQQQRQQAIQQWLEEQRRHDDFVRQAAWASYYRSLGWGDGAADKRAEAYVKDPYYGAYSEQNQLCKQQQEQQWGGVWGAAQQQQQQQWYKQWQQEEEGWGHHKIGFVDDEGVRRAAWAAYYRSMGFDGCGSGDAGRGWQEPAEQQQQQQDRSNQGKRQQQQQGEAMGQEEMEQQQGGWKKAQPQRPPVMVLPPKRKQQEQQQQQQQQHVQEGGKRGVDVMLPAGSSSGVERLGGLQEGYQQQGQEGVLGSFKGSSYVQSMQQEQEQRQQQGAVRNEGEKQMQDWWGTAESYGESQGLCRGEGEEDEEEGELSSASNGSDVPDDMQLSPRALALLDSMEVMGEQAGLAVAAPLEISRSEQLTPAAAAATEAADAAASEAADAEVRPSSSHDEIVGCQGACDASLIPRCGGGPQEGDPRSRRVPEAAPGLGTSKGRGTVAEQDWCCEWRRAQREWYDAYAAWKQQYEEWRQQFMCWYYYHSSG
jgi:hypothetical protein